MLDLHGKGAHTFVLAPWNIEVLRRKVEFIFRHGFRGFHNLLFDRADFAIHDGSYGWRRLRRLRGA